MKLDIKINNKRVLIAAAVASSFFSLLVCEAVQGLAAYIAGASEVKFHLGGIKLYAGFLFKGNNAAAVFLYSIPYLLMMGAITLCVFGLRKTAAGFYRFFFILFALIQSGFLIFNIFHGVFSVILKVYPDNDWLGIVSSLGLGETGGIIFLFFLIIFTAGYLNLVMKGILKYINI